MTSLALASSVSYFLSSRKAVNSISQVEIEFIFCYLSDIQCFPFNHSPPPSPSGHTATLFTLSLSNFHFGFDVGVLLRQREFKGAVRKMLK